MTTKRTASSGTKFTAEERAAMKERAAELKAQKTKEDGERAVAEALAKLPDDDRAVVTRLHELITAAGDFTPRTWYGMPAYAVGGDIIVFVQPASKFGTRYSTLGFNDGARLDDGNVWPTAYAVTRLTKAHEATVTALVKRALGAGA